MRTGLQDVYKRQGRYDLCILSTHGAYYTYEYGWLFKRTATEPLILLTERSDFWSDLRYGFDPVSYTHLDVYKRQGLKGYRCTNLPEFQAAFADAMKQKGPTWIAVSYTHLFLASHCTLNLPPTWRIPSMVNYSLSSRFMILDI